MYLSSDVLTLLYIICKNTDKIYDAFRFDLGYYFLNPSIMMDLVLQINNEKTALITDMDQHLYVEWSMKGGYFTRIVSRKLNPTGQRTDLKLDAVLLDIDSLYLLVLSHYSLPCGKYQWLGNPYDSSLPNISNVVENGQQKCLSKLMVKYQWNFMTR